MTTAEYYALLKARWERVDKTKLEEIRAYNEWKRALRRLIDDGDGPREGGAE